MVEISPIRWCNYLIRVPGWTDRNTLRLTIDDQQIQPRFVGCYISIDKSIIRRGSRIVLRYDLPLKQTQETMRSGTVYTLNWKGDEIISIQPDPGPLPFYPVRQDQRV